MDRPDEKHPVDPPADAPGHQKPHPEDGGSGDPPKPPHH